MPMGVIATISAQAGHFHSVPHQFPFCHVSFSNTPHMYDLICEQTLKPSNLAIGILSNLGNFRTLNDSNHATETKVWDSTNVHFKFWCTHI